MGNKAEQTPMAVEGRESLEMGMESHDHTGADAAGQVLGLRRRGEIHGDPALLHRSVHVVVRDRRGRFYRRLVGGRDLDEGELAWLSSSSN